MPFLESCFYGIQVTTDARWIFMDFRGTPLDSWEPSKTVSSYVVGLPCPLVVEYLKYTLTTLLTLSLCCSAIHIHYLDGFPLCCCFLNVFHYIFWRHFLDFAWQRLEWCAQSMQYSWTRLSFPYFNFFNFFLFLNTRICIVFMYINFHVSYLFMQYKHSTFSGYLFIYSFYTICKK